jgi:hypothetical protein
MSPKHIPLRVCHASLVLLWRRFQIEPSYFSRQSLLFPTSLQRVRGEWGLSSSPGKAGVASFLDGGDGGFSKLCRGKPQMSARQ